MSAKFIIRSEGILAEAMAALCSLDIVADTYEVEIKPHRRDRSLEQNDFMWALHREAAKHTGHAAEELHAYCCARFLGTRQMKLADGRVVEVPYSTTNGPSGKKRLTVEEMTEFLDRINALYAELGVPMEKLIGDREKATQKAAAHQ